MTDYAQESKAIQRLRRKVKRRLREETKAFGKRTLKKISQLIHLKLEKQKLDFSITQPLEHASDSGAIELLRRKIHRDSRRINKMLKKNIKFNAHSS